MCFSFYILYFLSSISTPLLSILQNLFLLIHRIRNETLMIVKALNEKSMNVYMLKANMLYMLLLYSQCNNYVYLRNKNIKKSTTKKPRWLYLHRLSEHVNYGARKKLNFRLVIFTISWVKYELTFYC